MTDKLLALADLAGYDQLKLREHVCSGYGATSAQLEQYEFLVAYESVGKWGCDSSSFFLLQRLEDDELFEIHGSHCSCSGFEDQFYPRPTSVKYLLSENFYFSRGGYDDDEGLNKKRVREHLFSLFHPEASS